MQNPRSDCTSENLPAPDHWSVAAAAAFEAETRRLIQNEGKGPTMAFDTKCFDLAESFLEDEPMLQRPRYATELAQLIQTTIEDFIRYERDNAEPPDPPGFEGGFAANH